MVKRTGRERMRMRREAMAREGIVEAYVWVPERQKGDLLRLCVWLCEQERAKRDGRWQDLKPMQDPPSFYGFAGSMTGTGERGAAEEWQEEPVEDEEERQPWNVDVPDDPDDPEFGATEGGDGLPGSSVASVLDVRLREWLQLYYTRLAERGIVPDADRRASDWSVVRADSEAWLQRDAVAEADRIADGAAAGS